MLTEQLHEKKLTLTEAPQVSARAEIHQALIYKVVPFVTQLLRDEYAPEIERSNLLIDEIDFKNRFLLREALDKCITING